MLRIYLTAVTLFVVECADNRMKITANATIWPAFGPSGDSSTIIISSNEMVPSSIDCHHNGKAYKEGEIWSSGHLRYKCMKLGAYIVLGCRTKGDRALSIGETYIHDFIAHQCFQDGSTTYYRESACDLVGQPSCDSIRKNPPRLVPVATSRDAFAGIINQTHGLPAVAGLPEGWKIVDAFGNTIPLSRISVVSSGIRPVESNHTIRRKAKRQIGKGVATMTEIPIDDHIKQERVVGVGDGSVSLDSRRPTISLDAHKMQPSSVAGIRSEVNWSGKTAMINGKRIAVGPGTFTFGNGPTGAFFQQIN